MKVSNGTTGATVRKRILVIEDQWLMSFMIDDMLKLLGYDVAGIASSMDNATDQIEHESFDAAILDVNLQGNSTFDLADRLQEKKVPFFFSTGYDPSSLPEEYQNCLALQKPYSEDQLRSTLQMALA